MLVIAVDGLADVLDGPLLATVDDQGESLFLHRNRPQRQQV